MIYNIYYSTILHLRNILRHVTFVRSDIDVDVFDAKQLELPEGVATSLADINLNVSITLEQTQRSISKNMQIS